MIGKAYSGCWKYLKESRNFVLFALCLFFFSTLFGLLVPVFLSDTIRKIMEDIVSRTDGMNFLQLAFFILQNNITASLLGLVTGAIFGVMPLVYLFFNGYVLGVVMGKAIPLVGVGVFSRILPHGIFEIPAVAISLGLGIRLGTSIFFKKKGKKGKKRVVKGFLYNLQNSAKTFFLVVLPLLIIAALIESSLMFVFG